MAGIVLRVRLTFGQPPPHHDGAALSCPHTDRQGSVQHGRECESLGRVMGHLSCRIHVIEILPLSVPVVGTAMPVVQGQVHSGSVTVFHQKSSCSDLAILILGASS